MKAKVIECTEHTITFQTEDSQELTRIGLLDGEVEVSVKTSRRSLSANGYLWTLLGKMAKVTNSTPIELYQEFVRRTGCYVVLKLKNEAVETFIKAWESNNAKHGHCGWATESLSKEEGVTYLKAYRGSSDFTPQEMQSFITEVEEEAKSVYHITVLPKEEREKLR